jgi:hypothetical protein
MEFDMDKEEVFVNLKVLERLDKNQKLVSRGPYINIERPGLIPECVRRWHRQDNRNEMLKKVNNIVNCAIFLIKQSVNSANNKESPNPKSSVNTNPQHKSSLMVSNDGPALCVNLENALTGLKNLKETYATCSQTCARLDVIIAKINEALDLYHI